MANPDAHNSGAFRIQKRTADHYEVFFKSFRSGVMLLVGDGLTKAQAEDLKERLNDTLYGYYRELKSVPATKPGESPQPTELKSNGEEED